MNVVVLIYLVKVRPHHNEAILVTTSIDEVVVMAAVVVFTVLYFNNDNFSDQKKRTIGLALVVVIILSVSKNFGVIIYKGIRYLRKAYRRRIKNKRRLLRKLRRDKLLSEAHQPKAEIGEIRHPLEERKRPNCDDS